MQRKELTTFSETTFSEIEGYNSPQITVVVRAYNEAENILATLESLRQQTFKNYEVIIVDNNSTDGTGELVQSFLASYPDFPGSLSVENEIGKGKALHTGVLKARSEWVACLDADSVAHPQWLETMVRFIKEKPDYIAGSGPIHFKDGPLHHRVLYKWGRNTIFSIASKYNQGWLSLANSWFRRSIFLESGGTKNLPPGVTADDRILALQLRSYGRIAYFENEKVDIETEDWLLFKPNWLSGLSSELDEVKQEAGIAQESLFHKTIKPISKVCSLWDGFK